jgi:hypothetical protein
VLRLVETGGDSVSISLGEPVGTTEPAETITIPLAEAREAFEGTLPRIFG